MERTVYHNTAPAITMSMMFLLQAGSSPQPPPEGVAVIFGLFGLMWCGMCLLAIALLVLWLWALIDCVQRDFDENEKIVWVLIIVLLNWLGAIIYLIIGRGRGRKPIRGHPAGPPADDPPRLPPGDPRQ